MPDGISLQVSLKRDDFAFELDQILPAKGITAVSGPSGSGKTTLLRIVAGLEEKATGRVAINDTVWQDDNLFVAPHKRRIGMVFQEPRLFPNMDVRANLLFGAKRAGLKWPDIEPMVATLGVDHLLTRSVRGLSGGEQRRIALARALAMNPDLLLLDEPLTGLDRSGKQDLLPFLCHAVAQANCPALFVSHDDEEIAALSDQVLFIEAGRVIGQLTPVPDCFDADVTQASHGMLAFQVGSVTVTLPGTDNPGTSRRLKIPSDLCTILPEKPKMHSAQACIPGRITGFEIQGARNVASVDIGTTILKIPIFGNTGSETRFSVGDNVWCLVNSVQLLPRRSTQASETQQNR